MKHNPESIYEIQFALLVHAKRAFELLSETKELWAFSDPHIDERAEFDKAWFAKVQTLLRELGEAE